MKTLQVLKVALAGGASVLALISPAAAKVFDIPDGDLATALDTYMHQSGVQLIYMDNDVRGHKTRGAKGDYTETAALTQILSGTGFTAQTLPSSTIDIVPQKSPPQQIAQATPRRAPAAPPPQQSALETVIVTAQHKSEDIQTVPIAITALSQQQLTDRQIAGGPDLLKSVPNMDFTKTNFSGYNIELRGIGTQAISVTTDPAVAVAFNGTPFIRNHFFEQEFYDLSDAEVLLGPQGTLYGRNATAGVVNIKSALPTDQYEAMLSADIGNYSNRRFEGMVNIPIVGDELDLRLAGEWTKRDGYTEDTTLGMSVDGRDLWSGRMTLGWKPVSNVQTYLVWEHFSEDDDRLRSGKQLCETSQPVRSVTDALGNVVAVPAPSSNSNGGGALQFTTDLTSQGCQATSLYAPSAFEVPYGPSLPFIDALNASGIEPAGFDPYAETTQSTNLRDIQSTLLPTYKAKNDTLEFNADWKINSALTFTSQTGFNQDFLWSTEDYNRFDTAPGAFQHVQSLPWYSPDPAVPGAYIFCDPQLGCSDRIVAEDLDEEHAWQLSQEFRLASDFGGPFNFSLGANYIHYETVENYYVFANALTAFSLQEGQGYGAGYDGYGTNGPGTDNCLYTQLRFRQGYQAPNPLAGGGAPVAGTCVYVDPGPIGGLNNEGHNYFLSQNPYILNSYAAFGETYYDITPDLKLTTGLRFTIDQKHFIDIPSELVDFGYGYWVSGIENQTWEKPTGRAVLDWTPQLDFTDQTLFYASYSHGYKAGGANPPGAVFPGYGLAKTPFFDHPLTFKPEYIEAFELGTKNTLLDGSLTLNGDVFYYNYTGYQISEIVDRTAINNNYNAHVEGAEVTANWEPLPGLKFNFAGGLEDTAAAGGDSGLDLMDRAAGMPGWMVIKPFVTDASNCVLPTYVVAAILEQQATPIGPGSTQGGVSSGACQVAYQDHLDPITALPYVPNPIVGVPPLTGAPPSGPCGNLEVNPCVIPAGYPGFNPNALVNGISNNDGEGFAKSLGGRALPNAPPFTVSLGGEYSLPVTEDWVATFRADFYWQADSWARIFNDNPYDRILGYDTTNVTLVLNSANGWSVMAYVKNVFNVTAITGDFLNSDDSGLTTNVFLTDPRLYGIRVTKQLDEADGFWGKDWSGADWIKDIFEDTDDGKPPFWIELGGQIEHIGGQGADYAPRFLSTYSSSSILHEGTTPTEAQQPPVFSAGEEAKVSWQPDDSDWVFDASIRYGRSGNKMEVHHQTDGLHYAKYSGGHPSGACAQGACFTQEKFVDSHIYHQEAHSAMDFMAGKDIGLGLFGEDMPTVLSAGIRIAQYIAHSSVDMRARPDLNFFCAPSCGAPTRFVVPYFHTYHANESATRKFHGIGPSISWSGSAPVAKIEDAGLSFDWGANAALLFGRQRTIVQHHETGNYESRGGNLGGGYYARVYQKSGGHTTNRRVTVPNVGGFAGISYRWNNAKISFGYRADLFFGAIDGGIDKRRSETLNMGGPFATVSFGLGG